jgi:hypothetical protein
LGLWPKSKAKIKTRPFRTSRTGPLESREADR